MLLSDDVTFKFVLSSVVIKHLLSALNVLCLLRAFNSLDLDLFTANGIVSSKVYDKRDDLNFEIVNFPFLM